MGRAKEPALEGTLLAGNGSSPSMAASGTSAQVHGEPHCAEQRLGRHTPVQPSRRHVRVHSPHTALRLGSSESVQQPVDLEQPQVTCFADAVFAAERSSAYYYGDEENPPCRVQLLPLPDNNNLKEDLQRIEDYDDTWSRIHHRRRR